MFVGTDTSTNGGADSYPNVLYTELFGSLGSKRIDPNSHVGKILCLPKKGNSGQVKYIDPLSTSDSMDANYVAIGIVYGQEYIDLTSSGVALTTLSSQVKTTISGTTFPANSVIAKSTANTCTQEVHDKQGSSKNYRQYALVVPFKRIDTTATWTLQPKCEDLPLLEKRTSATNTAYSRRTNTSTYALCAYNGYNYSKKLIESLEKIDQTNSSSNYIKNLGYQAIQDTMISSPNVITIVPNGGKYWTTDANDVLLEHKNGITEPYLPDLADYWDISNVELLLRDGIGNITRSGSLGTIGLTSSDVKNFNIDTTYWTSIQYSATVAWFYYGSNAGTFTSRWTATYVCPVVAYPLE